LPAPPNDDRGVAICRIAVNPSATFSPTLPALLPTVKAHRSQSDRHSLESKTHSDLFKRECLLLGVEIEFDLIPGTDLVRGDQIREWMDQQTLPGSQYFATQLLQGQQQSYRFDL
jgi:hypothetical protein